MCCFSKRKVAFYIPRNPWIECDEQPCHNRRPFGECFLAFVPGSTTIPPFDACLVRLLPRVPVIICSLFTTQWCTIFLASTLWHQQVSGGGGGGGVFLFFFYLFFFVILPLYPVGVLQEMTVIFDQNFLSPPPPPAKIYATNHPGLAWISGFRALETLGTPGTTSTSDLDLSTSHNVQHLDGFEVGGGGRLPNYDNSSCIVLVILLTALQQSLHTVHGYIEIRTISGQYNEAVFSFNALENLHVGRVLLKMPPPFFIIIFQN